MTTIDKLNKSFEFNGTFDEVEHLANELNNDNDDGWLYVPIYVENGPSFIDVYDENDEYLGKL